MITNLLTVDVEDWFHILDTPSAAPESTWPKLPSRVTDNTRRLLDMLEQHQANATFFILGWVAEHHPSLIREISDRGFDIASHGHSHKLANRLTPKELEEDISRSVLAISDACGKKPKGYRAAGFSITPENPWAFDVLASQGFEYDASMFPGRHGHGGYPVHHASPFVLETPEGHKLYEFPVASLSLWGQSLAFGGGGYFRLLPRTITTQCISLLI